MKKLVLLRGYPGSGKTTIGKALEKNLVGIFIDHNAILTFLANIVGNDDGIYEEIHCLEKGMTRKLLSEGKSAIVARGFSDSLRVEQYLSIARQYGAKVYILTLKADISILEKRVQSDERRMDFNPTITPEALNSWIHSNNLEPIKGEIIIDTSAPIDTVIEEVKRMIST